MLEMLVHCLYRQQKEGSARAEATVPITGFTLHLHEPFPHYIRQKVEINLIM